MAAGWMALAAPSAYALTTGQAAAFIENVGSQLVSIVNGPGTAEEKSAALARIIDRDVDVNGVAKFCLGRYWRVASSAQRQQYEALFHKVLLITISGRLGDYKGVRFTVGRATLSAEGAVVASTISTPNKSPAEVDWVVQTVGDRPQIVDVIAEGTSMRLTQRDDYSSFIAEHNQSVQALIDALRKQVEQNA